MEERILAIDIGGSHIKAVMLDQNGNTLTEYERLVTPSPATPEAVISVIKTLEGQVVKSFRAGANSSGAATIPYTKISAGFPGNVRGGVVLTAPNLEKGAWANVDLAAQLTTALGAPARVINDADMLGLGTVKGKGLEMMVTLGTGFGTAFLMDGRLLPHVELAHHPIKKGLTYDEYLGAAAFEKSKKKWNRRLEKVLPILQTVFSFDTLYLGGGNAAYIKFSLPKNVVVGTNEEGIHGGARLWFSEHPAAIDAPLAG